MQILNVDKITSGGDLLSKVDPYIEVGVRERTQRTRTIWNNKHPDFQEVFNLIVDDPDIQQLTLKLHDDDLGFNDPHLSLLGTIPEMSLHNYANMDNLIECN